MFNMKNVSDCLLSRNVAYKSKDFFSKENDLKSYSDLFCHLIYILDSINLTNLPPFLVSAHSQSVLVSKFVQYMLINLFPER